MKSLTNQEVKTNSLASGTKTRRFYIKHVALEDYDMLVRIKTHFKLPSDAATFRLIVRRVGESL